MKIIEIKNYRFKVDDEIYEKYHKCKFAVNVKRNKPILQLRTFDKKYKSFGQVILGVDCRIIYKDKDTTNLLLSNLDVQTKERLKAKRQEHYVLNISKYREKRRDYYQEHKEQIKEYQKNRPKSEEFKQNDRIRTKEYHRTLSGKFYNIKHQNKSSNSKKRREMEINITISEYNDIITKGCYYCGKNLFLEAGGSLDRIDNHLGYTIDNVLPCCGGCNMLRGNRLTVDETKYVINCLKEYRLKKEQINK